MSDVPYSSVKYYGRMYRAKTSSWAKRETGKPELRAPPPHPWKQSPHSTIKKQSNDEDEVYPVKQMWFVIARSTRRLRFRSMRDLSLLSHPSDLQPVSFEQITLLQLSSLPSSSYRRQQKKVLNNYKPAPRQTITMQVQMVCGIEGSHL